MSLLARLLAKAGTTAVQPYPLYTWGNNTAGQLGSSNVISRSSPTQVGSSNWTSVSSGNSFTVAIKTDGTLWGWGVNNAYQLGQADTIYRSSPVQIASSDITWSRISAGNSHTLAVATNGSLYAWGDNTYGQIGATNSWVQIARARANGTNVNGCCLMLRSDNTVWGIGTNSYGQWGNNTTSASTQTTMVFSFLGNIPKFTFLAMGRTTFYGLDYQGKLYVCGQKTYGTYGDYSLLATSTPTLVHSDKTYSKLSVTDFTAMAITTSGTLWAWGQGTAGNLGNNSNVSRSSPVQVGTDTNWSYIACGESNGFAIKNDGTLWGWGQNFSGELGINDTISRSSPVQVLSSNSFTQVSIATASNGPAAIATDGTLWVWGDDSFGRLGQGTRNINRSSPVQIPGSWLQVSVGSNYMLGIKSDGTVWGWGSNADTQLTSAFANGLSDGRSSPVQIPSLPAVSFSFVSASSGGHMSIAQAVDGRVYGWGTNDAIDSPVSTANTPTLFTENSATSPVGIAPSKVGSSSWTLVSAGGYHTLATSTFNKLFSWGRGDSWQTGLGDTFHRSSPVQVPSLSAVSITQISAGEFHNHAINNSGQLYGWGSNSNNEVGYVPRTWKAVTWYSLGDGYLGLDDFGTIWSWGRSLLASAGRADYATTARSSPVQVPASSLFTTIHAGVGNGAGGVVALDTNYKLWYWGDNGYGQAGSSGTYGSTITFPTMIVTDKSWTIVRAGGTGGAYYWFGIDTTGVLWAQGGPGRFLGINSNATATTYSSPVQVGTGYSTIAVGTTHVVAVKTDGTLWSWGDGTNGALGTSTTVFRSSPTQIGANTNWVAAAAFNQYSFGFTTDTTINGFYGWGLNTAGQIGDGTLVSKSSPVLVTLGAGIVTSYITKYGISPTFVPTTASSSAFNNFQILDTKGVWWACGTFTIQTIGHWPGLSVTNQTSLGLAFDYTNLQQGPVEYYKATLQVSGLFSTAISNSLIDADGGLHHWGYNNSGQTGIPDFKIGTDARSSPVQTGSGNNPLVPIPTLISAPSAVSYNQVSSGRSHSVLIKSDNSVWSWGANTSGRIPTNKIQSLYVGVAGALAVTTGNEMFFWGHTQPIPMAACLGPTVYRSSIVQITTTMANATPAFIYSNETFYNLPKWSATDPKVKMALGRVGFFLDHKKRLWGWGPPATSMAEMGWGTTISRSAPARMHADFGTIDDLYVSSQNRYWIKNGTLYGVGDSNSGQLGFWTSSATASPVVIDSNVANVWTASSTLVYKKTDNSVWTLGSHGGWLTFTTTGGNVSTPTQLFSTTDGANYTSFAMDNQASSIMAIKTNGAVVGWGNNGGGRLGINNITTQTSPTQVLGMASGVTAISGYINGGYFVLKSDYTVWAWGTNNTGIFGDGFTTTARSSPVQITWGGITSWSQIVTSLGSAVNAFLVSYDGYSVYASGQNTYGLLADGTTINKSSPVQITIGTSIATANLQSTFMPWKASNSSYTQISNNGNSVFAIRSDNTLWAWGDNTNGQLGDASAITRSSPVQITAISNTTGSFSQVSTGYNHTAMIFKPNL